jgi:hypothetical protein
MRVSKSSGGGLAGRAAARSLQRRGPQPDRSAKKTQDCSARVATPSSEPFHKTPMFCRRRALGRLLFAVPHTLSAGACIGFKSQAIRRACRRDERHRSRGAIAPESCINRLPSRSKRAQGRPGAGRTHGPPATKKAGGSHHRLGRDTRPSLRNGFNGVLSLGTGLSCPHRREDHIRATWHQRRDARTTTSPSAPGSFVRAPIARCDPTRPSHPALNVRDDREAPL